MPLTATIRPPRSASTAAAERAGTAGHRPRPIVARQVSCGPHAGQALGWAWKRRSAGSSYSAWQAGHIVKPAIVVAGRS